MSYKELALVLIDGAEVIGEVTSENSESLGLMAPRVIRPVQDKTGKVVLQLFPHSLVTTDGEHIFNKARFVSRSTDVPRELHEAYVKETTGIILAALDAFEALGT